MTVCSYPKDLVPNLSYVFEKQPIVSGIFLQQVPENNLLADEKVPWKSEACSYLCIHLYYRSVIKPSKSFLRKTAEYSNINF